MMGVASDMLQQGVMNANDFNRIAGLLIHPFDVVGIAVLVSAGPRVAAVLRRQPAKPVMVRGDHSADYGSVVAAMVLLQQAGIDGVGLVTEPPETQ